MKVEKRIGDFAIAGAGVQVTLNNRGEFDRVGIGLTAVGSTAIKAKSAEELLKGKKVNDTSAARSAAALASDATNPSSDLRGPSDYKKSVVRVLVMRALTKATQRAQAGV